MNTPYIVTIFIDKIDADVANKVLANLGFGDNNFNIDCDSKFCFAAPLQQWEYDKIKVALDDVKVIYKLYEDVNDGNVKEVVDSSVKKENLSIVVKDV